MTPESTNKHIKKKKLWRAMLADPPTPLRAWMGTAENLNHI